MHTTLHRMCTTWLVVLFLAAFPAMLFATTVSPARALVNEGTTYQFTASSSSTWVSDCGTISASGLFKAPLYPKVCKVTAIATNGSGSASATASVVSPITMAPVAAGTAQGMTQQFTSSAPVKWIAKCGTITSGGLFTASATVGTNCTIEGIAASGTPYTVYGYDTILASSTFSITPMNPTLAEGATQFFSANGSATWSASCGAISSGGLYTSPSTPGSCTITATTTNGSGDIASTTAAIAATGSLTITPAAARVHAIGTQQFTASEPATWSADCGKIGAATGLFTAPTSNSSCIVTARATGSTSSAQTTVVVDMVNYLSWKGGLDGNGAQTKETLLTPSNVNSSHFKVKWTARLDGGVFAQPLYMNALTINSSPHNVVFVATTNDSVYALDGETGALLWHRSFLSNGITAVSGSKVNSPMGQIGVLGTPAIDPVTGTLYVVAETAEQRATYFPHRLHAIDVTNGHEKFNGPVLVSDANLQPLHKLQRPGLVIANEMVYLSFGSISDRTPYHGLLFAFDKQTLAKKYVWNSTTTGGEGALWMSGGAPAVDSSGNLYVTTGNGSFNGSTNFGEASIKLSPTLKVLDYFAPYNYSSLNANDVDLGSGNVAILPDQTGKFPHELILCGKAPLIYVLNRDKMGHVGSGTDNVIQRLAFGAGSTDTCFATPAFWNNHLYIAGSHTTLKTFTLSSSTGLLSSGAASHGSFNYGSLGAQPVISSNGLSNGIVWTLDAGTGQIFANNASNAAQLYSSSVPGGINHFVVPTVVNGHVYVGSQHELVAYTAE